MTLVRHEQSIAWDLRGAWAARRPVELILSDRCLIPMIAGHIEQVAVTGAFVIVDGWHVPVADVLHVEVMRR